MQIFYLNQNFDSEVWKNAPYKRRQFIKCLKKNIFLGKTKIDIKQLLGIESNHIDSNRWRYSLYKSYWHKGRIYVLALYFENDVVIRMGIEYRYKYKHRVFGV